MTDLAAYHEEMPIWVERWLTQHQIGWRTLLDNTATLPPHVATLSRTSATQLEAVVKAIIWTDPVAWVECTFVEREENGGGFWRLYPKQRQLISAPCSLIVKGGSEIGKTRVMVAEGLFTALVLRQDVLITGHNDSLGEEIFDLIDEQLSNVPVLARLVGPDAIKQKPRRTLRAPGAKLTYTTVGNDGKPLRGFHISGRVLGDECAEWENRAWIQFWRCGLKTALFRVMSMPNGRTDSEFHRLFEGSPDLSAVADPAALPGLARMRIARWDTPWYDQARDDQASSFYGGRDSASYQQNVLGEDGTASASTFDRALLDLAFAVGSPPVRHIDVEVDPVDKTATLSWQVDDFPHDLVLPCVDLSDFRKVAVECAGLLRPSKTHQSVLGGDFGYFPDPSELYVLEEVEEGRLNVTHRLSMRRAPYPLQEEIYLAVISAIAPAYGVGVDATGAGLAPCQNIEVQLGDRDIADPSTISGWKWNLTHHPDLEALFEEGKPGCHLKEFATQQLEAMLAARTIGLAHDRTLLGQLKNLTSRTGQNGRTFTGKDHSIDALLAALLRWVCRGNVTPSIEGIKTVETSGPAAEMHQMVLP